MDANKTNERMETKRMECGLVLDARQGERSGCAIVTAISNGEEIHRDTINLNREVDRMRFAKRVLAKVPGYQIEAVERELLAIAPSYAERSTRKPTGPGAEIALCRVVRPELFFTSDVSGVTVPTAIDADGQAVGRWMTYLRWADGRRERRELAGRIALNDAGDCLFVDPVPCEPSLTTPPNWSEPSRTAWLAGESPHNPVEVFDFLYERLGHYIDIPHESEDGTLATLALWVMLTYFFPAWESVPYLYVGGPAGSGKSRVFDVLRRVVHRPIVSSNMSAPCMFRTLHEEGGTLLLDEAERLRSDAPDVQELRSVLLAGHQKGGTVHRMESLSNRTFRKTTFQVYGPKAMACIKGLPSALLSRCLVVRMFRAKPGSAKPLHCASDDDAWPWLCDALHVLAIEHGQTWLHLAKLRSHDPGISNRNSDLWRPLLSIAGWLEENGAAGLCNRVRTFALKAIDDGRDDQTPEADELLLRTLANLIRAGDPPRPSDVLRIAREAEPEPLRYMTAKGVANTLRQYGLRTTKSNGEKRYTHVSIEDLERVQERYGIDLGIEHAEHVVT